MSINIHTEKENATQGEPLRKNDKNKVTKPLARRVPLGGKDQNKAFPTLLRSNTGMHMLKQTGPKRQPLGDRAPLLRKANSLLGFVHQKKNPLQKQLHDLQRLHIKKANPLSNNLFKAPFKLENSSDSLEKRLVPPKPPVPSLASTLSNRTRQLHAENLLPVGIVDVDPIKKLSVPQHLIEDPNSIETIPEKPNVPYQPEDVPRLNQDDIDTLQKGAKLTSVNAYEYPDIHQNELKLRLQEFDLDTTQEDVNLDDQPKDTEVGLTALELNNLLDF